MKNTLRGLSAAVLATCAILLPISATAAPTSIHHYSSCAAVHRSYSGGIAKKGVYYNTIRHSNGTITRVPLKGHVLHSTSSYLANRRLDRDHDGVACEKS